MDHSRAMQPTAIRDGVTLHLVPESVWLAQAGMTEYRPESFDRERFVHCSDGEERLLAAGNRYYQADPRAYLVLEIDLARVTAPVVYEDAARVFPHVYGPVERNAVQRVRRVVRAADGTFAAIGAAVVDRTA